MFPRESGQVCFLVDILEVLCFPVLFSSDLVNVILDLTFDSLGHHLPGNHWSKEIFSQISKVFWAKSQLSNFSVAETLAQPHSLQKKQKATYVQSHLILSF